jgi:hypothetical protein
MTTATTDPRWLALSKTRQDSLLEEYRDINVHDDWWEYTYEGCKEGCSALGIEVEQMSFSGFWSQGDGACFTGHVCDWDAFLKHVGETDGRLAVIAAGRHNFNGWEFKLVSCDSRYSHANTITSNCEFSSTNSFDPEADPLRHASYALLLDSLECDNNKGLDDLETTFLEACRALMHKLYKDLEAEHDHLTSDEEVVTFLLEHDEDVLTDPDEDGEDDEEEEEAPTIAPTTLELCLEI